MTDESLCVVVVASCVNICMFARTHKYSFVFELLLTTHLQHRCGLIVDAYINACMVFLYTMHACIATAWAWLLPAHDAMNGRRFDLLSPLSFSTVCNVCDVSHRDLFTEASVGREIPSEEGWRFACYHIVHYWSSLLALGTKAKFHLVTHARHHNSTTSGQEVKDFELSQRARSHTASDVE